MKRLCVLTLALCCLSWIATQAQTQEVFPTKNARWEVLVPAPDYDPPLNGTERGGTYLIYMVGTDSIIGSNGLKYYDLLVDSLYAGSLRTEGERVWITFDNGDHETLLYDFGVKVGDTVRQKNTRYFLETPFYKKYGYPYLIYSFWDLGYQNEFEWQVREVKESICGKEIRVMGSSEDVWKKNIGSLHGMFLGRLTTSSGGNAYGGCLWKQEINGIRNYPEQDYGDIENQVGLSEIYEDQCMLSYDPDSKILQLTIQEITDTYQLKIYSADGTCVFHKKLSNGESSISLSSLPSGAYICKLSKAHQTITTQKIRL